MDRPKSLIMDDFVYREGVLHAESCSLPELAAREGTPLYVYSRATLLGHVQRLREAFAELEPLICFSVKCCSTLGIVRTLADFGVGMDLVSGGELHRVLLAGVDPARCVQAGVGKTDGEIEAALRAGVGLLNIESEEEFDNVARIAGRIGIRADAALRINPDVDPKTHRYTTTGTRETKFGVDLDRAREFFLTRGRDERCRLTGVHVHIGSPVDAPESYCEAIRLALGLIDELAAQGIAIETLDLGGGFGADYETGQAPDARAYAAAIVPLLRDRVRGSAAHPPLRVILEPGRTIAANAGVLLVRVLYTKRSGNRVFAICDGGMNVLLRPSHYGAWHFIWPVAPGPEMVPPRRARDLHMSGLVETDVVGPICESGDFLGTDRRLPPLKRGDLLAVFGAGAYGMSMANRYNSMPLPAEVLVSGDASLVIRRRESFDDLTAHERAGLDEVSAHAPGAEAGAASCAPGAGGFAS